MSRVVISGSRPPEEIRMDPIKLADWHVAHIPVIEEAVRLSGFEVTVLIEGEAPGIDTAARMWAEGKRIPVDPHPADWAKYKKAAGFIRNQTMAQIGQALIAIYPNDEVTRGTADMVARATRQELPVKVFRMTRSGGAEYLREVQAADVLR